MEIHGNRVSRLPHPNRPPRSVSRGDSQGDGGSRSSAPVEPAGQQQESWRYERVREETREVYPDSISTFARRALSTYLEVGRPPIPEALVRLDCYV